MLVSDILYIIGVAIWVALSSCPLALTHCCCCKAGMITEPFTHSGLSSDWEVRSGSWTNPSSTYYQTSSTDAVILRIETLDTLESNGINITCKMDGEPRDTKQRLIFGWQDDNNFYCVEVRSESRTHYQTCSDTALSGYYCFAKIIKRIAGVESDCTSETTAFVEGGGYGASAWSVMACYAESLDTAAFNAHVQFNIASGPGVQPFPPTAKCYLPPLGRRVGIGTGDLVTNPAKFDDFVVNCPVTCTTYHPCGPSFLGGGGCLPLTAPTEIEASFGGLVPSGPAVGSCLGEIVASHCATGNCDAMNGPFLLTKTGPCTWSYATPTTACPYALCPGGVQNYFYTIEVQIKPGTGANAGKMVAEIAVGENQECPSVCKTFLGTFVIVAANPGDCRATVSGYLTKTLYCANSCNIESTLFTLVLSA
jgi:hypothetical protein